MKFRDLWKSALVVLASVATVLPGSALTAAEATQVGKPSSKPVAPVVQDVALNVQGVLTGYVVDEQGNAVASSKVVVRIGRKVIAETTTDNAGRFQVSQLRGGVYQIEHAKGSAVFRVWMNGTAPKTAKLNALVVAGRQQVRGQTGAELLGVFPTGSLFSVTAGVVGITAGVVGISEANSANDKADTAAADLQAVNAKLDALIATLN